jgi:hypothetical protein
VAYPHDRSAHLVGETADDTLYLCESFHALLLFSRCLGPGNL